MTRKNADRAMADYAASAFDVLSKPFKRTGRKQPANNVPKQTDDTGSVTFLDVVFFVFSYWRRQPGRLAIIFVLMGAATVADSLLPAASGRIVRHFGSRPGAPGAASAAAIAVYVFVGLAFAYLRAENNVHSGLEPLCRPKHAGLGQRVVRHGARLFFRLARQQFRRRNRA